TRDESTGVVVSEIQRVATGVWMQETDDPAAKPPEIEISESGQKSARGRGDVYVYSRSAVLTDKTKSRTAKTRARDAILEQKLKAIGQVLASFGLLDVLPKRKQEKLLKA